MVTNQKHDKTHDYSLKQRKKTKSYRGHPCNDTFINKV